MKKEERSPPSEFPVAFQACQKIDWFSPPSFTLPQWMQGIRTKFAALGWLPRGKPLTKIHGGQESLEAFESKALSGDRPGKSEKLLFALGRTKQRLGVSYALQIQRVGGSIACYGDISPIHHLRPREAVDSSNAFFADS
jgi:hypothetical protein